ncbi:Epl1p [Sporobolomyces salmoneus]|uniref:Epl1p n=1 Tax=Sporobolomyces salmoneus TaxID=183962 RepID=UPI00317F00F2
MAKGSGRFRNRKLGFKTRINVEIGVVIEEDPLEVDGLDLEDGEGIHERGGSNSQNNSAGGGGNRDKQKGIQTGVDKDEEGEVHLQQVIASTAAYVARNTTGGSSLANGKKPASAYIPTRSSTTLPDEEFTALYKPGYVDPISYIRFSDTVEDTTKGAINYTMDEDDEDWLEDFNEQFSRSTTLDKGKGREGEEKVEPYDAFADAGKCLDELSDPNSALSEDDFEKIMELFEQVTDEKAPMAHVDTSLLPPLLDFDYAFNDILRPELAALRPYAKPIYPHWKERRMQRGGKRIMPQLDYDESNEQNPYVCFRRRELKSSRKTRRSDQQNLERLIRLRNDLYAAHALMLKVAEREQIKLDSIIAEREIFEQRCEMREVKRKLGEAEGDEDLLVSRREKRRKREDGSIGALRLSVRKPDPNNISAASLAPSIEELQARKTRNENLVKQIERDLQRKRQADQQFEDWTDSSYLARPPPTPSRFWRSVEPTPTSGKKDALGFAPTWQAPIGRVRTSFRKRVGRGGRIYLDRIAPGRRGGEDFTSRRRILPSLDEEDQTDEESEPDEMDDWMIERRRERLKFDTDAGLDFSAADESPLVDDFELQYLVRRAALLKPQDVQALSFDSSYLEEAFKFVASDPTKDQPPPAVIGRPPPRPPLAIQPTGQPLSGHNYKPMPPNPAAYAQRPPSANHLPPPPNGGFPNHQSSPHSSPQNPNGLPLPPGSQPPPRMPNGALAVPGLQQNGMGRGSPLSQTPFSNPQAIQIAIQQQQQQQQAAAMQAANGMPGRPLSANSPLPPSRPASSASSYHHQGSPAMGALSLPQQQEQNSPHRSPVTTAAALANVNKRNSPLNSYQMQPGGPQQSMKPYGTF